MGIVAELALLGYVQEIGGRLARLSPRQDVSYTFQIVDQPAPNSLALPNGNICVSRGLLALATGESELAGVLGHEVIHAAARHILSRPRCERLFARGALGLAHCAQRDEPLERRHL